MNFRYLSSPAIILSSIALLLTNPALAKNSQPKAQELYDAALRFEQQNNLLKAQENLRRLLDNYPDFENIEEAQEILTTTNIKILSSNIETPQTVIHVVENGDTLGKIAKQYKTTVELVKLRNQLKNNTIKVGQKLSIWSTPFTIHVDKSSNILMLLNENEVVKVYHVSTGAGDSTPVGDFLIKTRLENPVWYHHGMVVPAGTPENFLGTRWLGFDVSKYGIHGTVEPEKIGQSVSAGCVRMKNEDVEELFRFIPLGVKVTITN